MTQVSVAVKLVMKVEPSIAACLDDQSRKANHLYNMLIERGYQALDVYKETGNKEEARIVFSSYGLRNLIPGIKEAHPHLKSVHASPLKNAGLRAREAFKNYFDSKRNIRKGRRVGRPQYNSWKRNWFSLLYEDPKAGFKVIGSNLKLSLGMGSDRKRHSLTIPLVGVKALKGKTIRNLRIVKEHGMFYAVFTVLRTVPERKPIHKIIALDPNHKNLMYGIDSEGRAIVFDAPHYIKQYDKRIDEVRSLLDHCVKQAKKATYTDNKGNTYSYWEGSRRYRKLQKTLRKLLAKRRDLTKAFCYRIANWLCRHYDLIAIGDYAPRGQGTTRAMRRAMNNRSLHSRLKENVSWTAIKSGKLAFVYDEKGTTRTCHVCGTVVEGGLEPSVRKWCCLGCSTAHDRDENAAFNGLKKVYKHYEEITGGFTPAVPCSGLVHSREQWACRVLASGSISIAAGLKQQLAAPTGN